MHAIAPTPSSSTSPNGSVKSGTNHFCAIYQQSVSSWMPHPHIEQLSSEFMKMMEGIGSDLSIYQCPNCGCNDRDRHLWLFMGAAGLLQALPDANVLHVAPERHIERLIQQRHPQSYVRGDLFPHNSQHIKLNLEALDMADDSFDLIICNHVLEHVQDLPKSLSELHRCLKPGGVLIAQTPYSPVLKYTMECTTEVTPEFAEYFFGQNDHVRLFGADIVDWFHRAGFRGEPIDHKFILSELDPMSVGCNHREPFFAFTK